MELWEQRVISTQIKFTTIYLRLFDIHPTEVVYNVGINANQKAIKNIKLDRNSDNSAATIEMVKELIPFTKNALYRKYFSDFYDSSIGRTG